MKITLCGSTKFEGLFFAWDKALTTMGHIVYSLGAFPAVENKDRESKGYLTDEQKEIFDLVYYAKIEESDAILVLNPGNYIGESCRREIAWARIRNKKVYWLKAPVLGPGEAWIEGETSVDSIPGFQRYTYKYGLPEQFNGDGSDPR
jgi:hypothetical protein